MSHGVVTVEGQSHRFICPPFHMFCIPFYEFVQERFAYLHRKVKVAREGNDVNVQVPR
jgi:hypothetical protein